MSFIEIWVLCCVVFGVGFLTGVVMTQRRVRRALRELPRMVEIGKMGASGK